MLFIFEIVALFNMFNKNRVHDKKLAIVAMCSLLSLSTDQIPQSLQAGWPQILVSISHVFESLPKAIESKHNLIVIMQGINNELLDRENMEKLYSGQLEEDEEEDEEAGSDEEEEEEEEEEGSGGEEESSAGDEDGDENEGKVLKQDSCNRILIKILDEDVQDEDTEYLEYLNQQAANQNNEDTDADEDEEEEIAEEIMFESPLDEIDPYICFEQVFRGKKNLGNIFQKYIY